MNNTNEALEILTNEGQPTTELSVFSNQQSFEHAQRVAKMLSSSNLIPQHFQGNIQNTLIALEMSNRIGATPLMVMQNLYIVHGKPSWSSTFIIAAINATKKFTPLRFKMSGEGEQYGCTAWALEKGTDERLESPKVTMKMAQDEGWLNKAGSKWKTMPELMLRYRAATFFGRLYAPEILMGMQTAEEVQDVHVLESDIRNGQHELQHEELKQLFDMKEESLAEDVKIAIDRIIKNKETANYKKAHAALMSA